MNAIEVNSLSKCYSIGKTQSGTLREALSGLMSPRKVTEFWALNDVSFQLSQGDTLGIIGKNGAGKSTLLKILSRITKPTSGEALIYGRVSSLLEVGTGFHPELTGRENIYLNGSILGMNRAEIKRKFDEIVDFSGVQQFLDTPVKHYSSGMYVRLAFSVAAHLEPEILIVDEVLAVGDAEFQEKCLGKMDSVAKSGRTIIFVSHNMSAIERLCNQALWLNNGEVKSFGPKQEIINGYLSQQFKLAREVRLADRIDRRGSKQLWFNELKINDGLAVASGKPCTIKLGIKGSAEPMKCLVNVGIHDQKGMRLFTLSTKFANRLLELKDGNEVMWTIPRLSLIPGKYRINLFMANRLESDILDWITDAAEFEVSSSSFFQDADQVHYENDRVFTDQSIEVI